MCIVNHPFSIDIMSVPNDFKTHSLWKELNYFWRFLIRMRIGGYICIALLMAGLATWAISYIFEPKLHFIKGNLRSVGTEGSFWHLPLSQELMTDRENNITGKIDNKTISLLTTRYGASANMSRVMLAIVEDQSGRRVGVGLIISSQGSEKLVVVLPDGWTREYDLPKNG